MPDVLSMLQLGELKPDTLGWHTGCEQWLPLRELPALADFFAEEPALEEPPPIAVELGEKLPPNLPPLLFDVILPGPMARFLARMVDMGLYASLLLGVFYVMKVPYADHLQPGSMFFWLPWVLIEACLISQCGVTPGKWLLGIRMQSTKGKLRFPSALLRSVIAFILGLGCMYAPFLFVMLIISYFSVRRRGVAIWDVNSAIVPMMASAPTPARKVGACLAIFLCIQLSGNFMRPWLPDMIDIIRERDPKAAQVLEEWTNRDFR